MSWVRIALFLVLLLALAKPLGEWMARVFEGRTGLVGRVFGSIERFILRAAGIRADEEMDWRTYARAFIAFHVVGFVVLYALQRAQGMLPLNPAGMGAVAPDLAFNTAVSFVTNTNWQSYGGETTMSHLTQMLGLTVQNFVSAASGIAVLLALIRGFTRKSSATIGSFWVDLVRATTYVLLPLSLVLALVLASQGVVQTLDGRVDAHLLDPITAADGSQVTDQAIAVGPAASQIAIKQLGTNGGGFFNVNSAHPFENPTPLTNLLEVLSILILSAALCFTLGALVKDRRQGVALLLAMLVILIPCIAFVNVFEQTAPPALDTPGIDTVASELQPGGNMEGKEARFGIADSAIWAVATTAASNGSVNAMHDSFTPLGGMLPMWLMQLGEVVFGGVGSGLYGMILFAIVAVFVAGLMVGRTPEYLGKKIHAFEMKMASLAILAPCIAVLVGTAIATATDAGRAGVLNPGPHGFSEMLYAFSSAGNNNGSAFGGLTASTPFYDTLLGLAMLVGRFLVALPVLAIAGSLAKKRIVPAGPGTLATHDALFVGLLVAVVLLVGALTFLPALALGPIVEQLGMTR